MDNCHGEGRGDGNFIVNGHCPVHADRGTLLVHADPRARWTDEEQALVEVLRQQVGNRFVAITDKEIVYRYRAYDGKERTRRAPLNGREYKHVLRDVVMEARHAHDPSHG